jgi:hypothetical protein
MANSLAARSAPVCPPDTILNRSSIRACRSDPTAYPGQHDFQQTKCRWRKGRPVQGLQSMAPQEPSRNPEDDGQCSGGTSQWPKGGGAWAGASAWSTFRDQSSTDRRVAQPSEIRAQAAPQRFTTGWFATTPGQPGSTSLGSASIPSGPRPPPPSRMKPTSHASRNGSATPTSPSPASTPTASPGRGVDWLSCWNSRGRMLGVG